LDPVGEDLEAAGAAGVGGRLAAHEVQQPPHAFVAEVLDVRGVGIQGVLDGVVPHRRADADPWVQPSAGQDVDCRQVFGQPQRVLPPQRDHRGPQVDAAGALRRGRQHSHRRGDAVLQVTAPHPRAVEPQPLAQLDDLQRRLMATTRIVLIEQSDGQKTQPTQRFRHRRYTSIV
jgi:hypothetical protein